MARLTNAQLLAELEALRVHSAKLETEIASLKAAALAQRTNPAHKVRPVYIDPLAAQRAEYRAACAAAAAEAHACGSVVVTPGFHAWMEQQRAV